MKVRKAEKTTKDFEAYHELYDRTDWSYEIGKVSKEKTEFDPIDPPLNYEQYCSLIDFTFKEHLMFENNQGEIIGSATVIENEIEEFFIKREYQLQGNGSIFYRLLEYRFKSQKNREIILKCYHQGAACFWRKMGFKGGLIFVKKI